MRKLVLEKQKKLVVIMIAACIFLICGGTHLLAADSVKVGYTISLSGVYTALGVDLRDGFNLYMEECGNKAGGREIQVIVEDIGSNQVSRALDTARKLIEKDRVQILAGVVGSGTAYALAEYVESMDLRQPVFCILTPLPGTVLYEERKADIITNDYGKYDLTHTVLPTRLPIDEFYEQYANLYRRSYLKERDTIPGESFVDKSIMSGVINKFAETRKTFVSMDVSSF